MSLHISTLWDEISRLVLFLSYRLTRRIRRRTFKQCTVLSLIVYPLRPLNRNPRRIAWILNQRWKVWRLRKPLKFRTAGPEYPLILLNLYLLSMSGATFPPQWKTFNNVLHHKHGSMHEHSINHNPVLPRFISKEQLVNFLTTHNLMNPSQHVFLERPFLPRSSFWRLEPSYQSAYSH